MALNTSKRNHLMPLCFKGLTDLTKSISTNTGRCVCVFAFVNTRQHHRVFSMSEWLSTF